MRRILAHITLLVSILMVLSGCERRDLSYVYHPWCAVRVNVDWSNFPETPTGMTLMFFSDQSTDPVQVTTNEINSTTVDLRAGNYQVYVFNQSVSEFGSLGFEQMSSYTNAQAYINEMTSTWYKTTGTEKLGKEAENLGVDYIGHFEITEEMVSEYQEYITKLKTKGEESSNEESADLNSLDGLNGLDGLDAVTTVITLYPKNLITELNVKVYMKGIYNLSSTRASINKFAEGFMMTQNTSTNKEISHLMETWTKHIDPTDATRGYVETTINTFGLPNGVCDSASIAKRDSTLNQLGLSFLLVDNKTTATFNFNVGNRFKVETGIFGIKLRLDLVLGYDYGITLPDVTPINTTTDGGFDATVDDWEDGENVNINM